MELMDAIKKRYSCRAFLNKEVEEEKIKQVLDAARLAASGRNLQPWYFLIAKSKDAKEKIKVATPKRNQWFADAPVIIICCLDHRNVEEKFYNLIDLGVAAENLALRATDLGLGSCFVAGFDREKLHSLLGLDSGLKIQLAIPLGYPKEEQPELKSISELHASIEKGRKPIAEISEII